MELSDKIKFLFESDEPTEYIPLKKVELDDNTFLQHLAIKPSEINIILARVVSFIKQDDPQKTKQQLVNDILQVLERSDVAREFASLGLKQDYALLKGFPVRKGDPYETMPDPNSELVLKPTQLYIGWTSNVEKAREMGVQYDQTKGEPIGGLLVKAHVDPTKILFDINAIINIVRTKKSLFEQYNAHAAPGKSLSKSNIAFLANNIPEYNGVWEIITTNKVLNTLVVDKWSWDTSSGKKTPKWTEPSKSETAVPEPAEPQKDPQAQKVQESILRLFESADIEVPELMDEGIGQGIKNFFAKLFSTSRGKMIKFLDLYVKFYDAEAKMLEAAITHAKNIDENATRINVLKQKLQKTQDYLHNAKVELNLFKDEKVPNVPEPVDNSTQQDIAINAKHQQMKDLKGSTTDSDQQLSDFEKLVKE